MNVHTGNAAERRGRLGHVNAGKIYATSRSEETTPVPDHDDPDIRLGLLVGPDARVFESVSWHTKVPGGVSVEL
jgi:hypothetical protein